MTGGTPPRPQAVIVLGMHRSGTSALTGTLHRLGVALGANLMPPIPGDNDKGFYENDDIVPVHERLFATLGSSWHDVSAPLPDWWQRTAVAPFRAELAAVLRREFGAAPLWGVKDPRICRFLPLWLDLLDAAGTDAKLLLIWRHPFEVAESLRRRQGFDRPKSYLLWFRYMREAEVGSRGRARTLIGFADFLADWRGTIQAAAGALGLPALAAALPGQAADIDAFLSSDLHRNRVDDAAFVAEAPSFCVDLLRLFEGSTPAALAEPAAFDAVYRTFDDWQDAQPWPDLVADLKHRLVGMNEAAAAAEAERQGAARLTRLVACELQLADPSPPMVAAAAEQLFASRAWRAIRRLRHWHSRVRGLAR